MSNQSDPPIRTVHGTELPIDRLSLAEGRGETEQGDRKTTTQLYRDETAERLVEQINKAVERDSEQVSERDDERSSE